MKNVMIIQKAPFLLALVAAFALVAPAAIAADLTDVGYIDQAAIGALPQFQKASAQVTQYQEQLNAQFTAQSKGKSATQTQHLAADLQKKFFSEQKQVLGPLYARAQTAIAQTASNRGLSVVVDKRIVVYGGQDITKDVIGLIDGPGAVVPPSATPPPSEIGFVDQEQIDQLPKIKQANDAFTKFSVDQRQSAYKAMQAAKGNKSSQEKIFQDYQNAVTAQQDKTLKPLVDQTRDAMAKVAQQKHLVLVLDRSDVIYGGTDITSDVQNALK